MRWQCEACMIADEQCFSLPNYACQRCQIKKNKCSLMVTDPRTGKTDRRMLEDDLILKHHIEQTEALRRAGIKKGKQRARRPPDAGEPEGSGVVSSPSAMISALGSLALESGGSSAVDTPSLSPASLLQPSFPEVAAPSPPIASAARQRRATKRLPASLARGGSSAIDTPSVSPASPPRPSSPQLSPPQPSLLEAAVSSSSIAPAARSSPSVKCSKSASSLDSPVTTPAQHFAGFAVVVPSVSQFLKPADTRPSHSCSDTSQASDGRSNSTRIAALERMVGKLEKIVHDHERRLKEMDM